MTVWSTKYVNDLPDSSFAWVESGGKKDSEGKTVPRGLRHLPYKDVSGKIDLPHVRNALARLNQVKGLPSDKENSIRSMLQKHLGSTSASIVYDTTFIAEIKKENDVTVIFISGTLMNDQMNENNWEVPREELPAIAEQFKGHPIRMQHSENDWEIVGSGVDAIVSGNDIKYVAKITDTAAVDKFVSGTWTKENMGISPRVHFETIECSICGEDMKTCEHIVGRKYDGVIASAITKGNKLQESSLTSHPAYNEVGAGFIEGIDIRTMVASIQKMTNTEEKVMAEKTKLDEMVAEMSSVKEKLDASKEEIKTLKAQIEKIEESKKAEEEATEKEKAEKAKKAKEAEEAKKAKDKPDEGSGDEDEKEAELAKIKEELEASKKENAEYKKTVRTAELSGIISDKEFVTEILGTEMTDSEFKAEIAKIKKVQELSAQTDTSNGSALAENGDGTQADVFQAEFGSSKDDIVKRIMEGAGVKE